MKKNILMLGTFDSKGNEFNYLRQELLRRDVQVLSMDTGVFAPCGGFPVDIPANEVALAGGCDLETLAAGNDRGRAMEVMALGARALVLKLYQEKKIDGVISMGGGGGTSVATTAMQALPVGLPKVCITTLASGDTHEYVGTKDVLLFPSIVDICGLNQFSRIILSRAAGAVCGMALYDPLPYENDKPLVCVSMFGNTTPCAEKCTALLEERGYAPLVFHATGSGGRAMEELVKSGMVAAVLDITTTEWADELCGGILSAGPERLEAPGISGIPHVVAPGCLDMVNFGSEPPPQYKKRLLYKWNPMVTLMRTNEKENEKLGVILTEKTNRSRAPVAYILPLRGISILDGEGQIFQDWEADRILFQSIRKNVRPGVRVEEVDANINDDEFARCAVNLLENLLKNNVAQNTQPF